MLISQPRRELPKCDSLQSDLGLLLQKSEEMTSCLCDICGTLSWLEHELHAPPTKAHEFKAWTPAGGPTLQTSETLWGQAA